MMNHEYEKQTLEFVISRNAYPLYHLNLRTFYQGNKACKCRTHFLSGLGTEITIYEIVHQILTLKKKKKKKARFL